MSNIEALVTKLEKASLPAVCLASILPKGLAPFSYTVHGQVHEQSKHIYDRDNQKSDRKGAKIAINGNILVKNVI